jgi:hypothetical protein
MEEARVHSIDTKGTSIPLVFRQMCEKVAECDWGFSSTDALNTPRRKKAEVDI